MTAMAIDHVNVAVPSARLPEMLAFYTGTVGLREGDRPPLPFPGHFLYSESSPIAVLHLALMGCGQAADRSGGTARSAGRCPRA